MMDEKRSHERKLVLLAWAGIVAVYLSMALAGLSHQDLDQDELITSLTIRQLPLLKLIVNRFQEGHPPLYFLLAKTWLAVLGHTAFALYLLSVAIGACAVAAMGALARELGLGRWSLIAALLWAMHPTLQYYARYARPMIGVILFSTLMIWLTIVALRRQRSRAWNVLLAVGLLGAIWNHMIALAWLGLAVAVALTPEWRKQRRFWYCLLIVTPVHVASLLGVVWASSYDDDPMGWIDRPAGTGWIIPFLDVLGGWLSDWPPLKILSMCVAACIVLGVAAIQRRGRSEDPWRLVAAAALVPAAMMLMGTALIKPMLVPRYMIVMVPPAFLFVIWALTRIRPRAAVGCCAGLAALMIAGAPANIDRHSNGLRKTVRQMERRLEPGDRVMVFNFMTAEALRLHGRRPIDSFECPRDKETQMSVVRSNLAGTNRVWLLSYRSSNHKYFFNLIKSPEWTQLVNRSFFKASCGEARLRGYKLHPAGVQKITTATPAQL